MCLLDWINLHIIIAPVAPDGQVSSRWFKWVSMTRGIPGNLFSQLSFLSLEKMILQAQAFTFFCLQLTPSDYNSSFNCCDLMHSAMLSLFRSSYSDIRPVVKVLQEHYSGWQETAHRWSDIIVGINLQLLAILSLNLVSTLISWQVLAGFPIWLSHLYLDEMKKAFLLQFSKR